MGGAIHFLPDGTLAYRSATISTSAWCRTTTPPWGKCLRMNTMALPPRQSFLRSRRQQPGRWQRLERQRPRRLDWIDYVWASGLRNPFSGDVDPATGRYFINDVGEGTWEEINDATARRRRTLAGRRPKAISTRQPIRISPFLFTRTFTAMTARSPAGHSTARRCPSIPSGVPRQILLFPILRRED